jgi:hypothetical protein
MQTQPPSWWVTYVAIPALFTLFGLFLGEFKDWWQWRRSKKAFFKAIAVEAEELKSALEQMGQLAESLEQRLLESGQAPQLGLGWITSVFDTQLGKLRDVDDDLILQIIKTYAAVGRVRRNVEQLNEDSRDYVHAAAGREKSDAQNRLRSVLRVLKEEVASTLPKLQTLIQNLNKELQR